MDIAPLFDLTGKVAVVTGGGNGIGRASARILAQAGADVVIADMKQDDAQQVADEIETTGRRAIAVACNVGKEEQLQNLVERTLDVFGKLNILVNNVGIGGGGRENPFKITLADFERVYDINVFSTWRLCQLAVPHMKASGYGSIVNISSMSSINSSPDMSAYASSKAAINHMTANLAFDFAPEVVSTPSHRERSKRKRSHRSLPLKSKNGCLPVPRSNGSERQRILPGQSCSSRPPFRPGLPDRCFSSTAAVNKPWIKHRIEI